MVDALPVRRTVDYPNDTLVLGTISADVVGVQMVGSTLTPPSDPALVGWWGRSPHARQGSTVLVGHTVHTGGGVFDNLEDTPVGTSAHLWGETFKVTRVETLSKDVVAAWADQLFNQSGTRRLVVVTCEDWDPMTGDYDSNVVVTAVSTNRKK